MKFRVGDVCKVKKGCEKNCSNFHDSGAVSIKIIGIDVDCYQYDFYTSTGKRAGSCNCFNDDDLILLSKAETSLEKAKYGIKYDINGDPVEFFATKKDAEKRIKELLQEEYVDKDSIYFFELGKIYKVDQPVKYELVEVK
jgi:hypothetical protein